MGEECVEELKLGHIMMNSLRKSFEQVHAHYEKVERDLEERRKEMVLKEDKLSSLETQTREQLHAKRKEVTLEEGRLHSCSQKLKCRKLELESIMQSVKDSSTKLAAMKEELVVIRKSSEEKSKEVLLKKQHLATVQKSLEEFSARVELKKKELNSVEKAWAEQHKESVSLRRSLEDRLRGVEMKEMQLDGRAKDLILMQQEIDLIRQGVEERKKELNLEKRSLVNLSKEVERKEAELEGRAKELDFKQNEIDAVRQTVEEEKKELEGKRKLHDLQKESLEERFRLVCMKEEELQVQSKVLESKGKKMDEYRRAVDDHQKLLERITATGPRSDSGLPVNDGCSLQILLNELLTKHSLVHDQFSSAIKTSDNPTKLVLDAVQGSYSTLGNDCVYEPEIVKKTCILLLDQLLVVNPPQIEPHLQNAAIQLAHEWRKIMKVGAEDQLEILRFLHLLAAFRISSAFRVDEYGALLDRVGDKNKASKL